MSLQENIRRILREEDYSPAGKEVTPNNIVIHKSNPMFRDKIMENGLKVRAGECYKVYVGYGVKCKPAIFATNSTNKRAWFDSTYDDDIWEINTEMIPDVKWYKDRHFESRSKHIVTFQDIPKEALTLKYEGTGSGDVKIWDKDSPNLYESIRRILRGDKKTKSTNKEFSKYKDSKFNTLRDYTLQDIVDNWDSLSDQKNENIKTIKYFVNNPDKITDLVYDEKGLEDGYHRLIAAKILKKPRFSYRLVENLQENIRRILREEIKLPNYIRRRIDFETIEQLYQFILKMCSQRYKDNKKNRDAITPYHFQQKVISNLVWAVCENYELECEDGGDNYKQMWDFLSNMYSKRTIKHFYEIR